MSEEQRKVRDPHVVVEKLTKRFADFYALKDIDLTVGRGEIAVIIGGSGAGKTTLLRTLVGLEKPTTGSICIDGTDIAPMGETELNRVRQKFGMVFQYAALLDSLTVMENVAFPLREHTKLKDGEIRERVREKLAILDLHDVDHLFPSELSGGMRKRVGLARALMLEPELLVYDEPNSGLDPLTSRLVDRLIFETRERFGVTSVVISHDMASALMIADIVFLLQKGEIVGRGTPAELVDGKSQLATDFLDNSGMDARRLLSEHLNG